MNILNLLILVIVIAFTLFYGLKAVGIFIDNKRGRAWWLHQFWINFIGCAAGWLSLFCLFVRLKSLGWPCNSGDTLLN